MTSPTSSPETNDSGTSPAAAADQAGASPPDVVESGSPHDGVEVVPGTPDESDTRELERLRSEVTQLRTRLDSRQRRRSAIVALRGITAAILVAITAFALVASVVGVWSANTVLNTDRWVETVAPLPSDPVVANAVAEYATTELFEVLDVENRLRTVLPEQAAFVAGPLTGQIREAVQKTVFNLIQSDQFQRIWVEAIRRAHQRVLAILEGTSTVVVARQDRVEIDLLPMINQVLRELSSQLPTLFGKQLTLPDLSSGEIPDNLRGRIQDTLGVSLPANFAQFTIYDSGQLKALQDAVATAKRDLVLFVVGTFVLLILALLVSPRRRRTVLQLGIWLVIAAVAITAVLRRVREQLLLEVPAGTYRDAVAAVFTTVFATLRERGTQLLWIGAILAVVAYLVGPGRIPVWLRGKVVQGARAAGRQTRRGGRWLVANGPGWTARYLDAVRIAGVVVAGVLALILSSWTSLLVIVVVLAAFEIFVTLVARAAPASPAPPAVVSGEPPIALAGRS
jgi:hypothetical protein